MKQEKTFKGDLYLNLNVPYKFGAETISKAELLRTNGIAEEVFLKKLPEKPYTWIGNVISIAVGALNHTQVGTVTRSMYEKAKIVVIPPVVLALPLSEANSFLPEIHRRVWKNLIPHQEILCKYCGQKAIVDIELDKMQLSEASAKIVAEHENVPFEMLYVDLSYPLLLDSWVKKVKKESEWSDIMGKQFNRLVFRIPTLGDAIKHEKYATTDGIRFWRKIAFECLTAIQCVEIDKNEDGTETQKVVSTVPQDTFVWLGDSLLDQYLDAEDLSKVRFSMREELPTMPFAYQDMCPSCNRETPFLMEASSFFSE